MKHIGGVEMSKEDRCTVRVNINIVKGLHEYYKEKSRVTGIPMSYLMSMDLLSKAQQDEFVERFPELMDTIKKNEGQAR
jgi:hypothetical protein